jgi:hypothetical protein
MYWPLRKVLFWGLFWLCVLLVCLVFLVLGGIVLHI